LDQLGEVLFESTRRHIVEALTAAELSLGDLAVAQLAATCPWSPSTCGYFDH
jgi:hypothetical protein